MAEPSPTPPQPTASELKLTSKEVPSGIVTDGGQHVDTPSEVDREPEVRTDVA
jgi:hypothetical protein